jgi:1-aminocyclopropane-1-carboxylate deaminase/D-cysteine desulfhydrase-like pyridoxal-dependent ACC family enzyme
MIAFGRYPTPVQRVAALSSPGCELWIKRDDRTHEVYGGNKVRKLEPILSEASARGATRVVTVGAAGSHHVLATAYFGRLAGLGVEAVLVPQPRTEHVAQMLRAGLALGLQPFPAGSWSGVPLAVARRRAHGAWFIPVGGSSVAGSMAYAEAARELAAQVRAGELPEPDVCVVALGSGGTAAGLAAGLQAEGLATRVVGVCVADPPWLVALAARWLARACARRIRERGNDLPGGRDAFRVGDRLAVDGRFLGAGYACPIDAGAEATALAREHAGIELDSTYTAKAFASALWHVRARRAERVLYWHTLSSAPMEPLLEGAPPEGSLHPSLRALLLPASSPAAGHGALASHPPRE